MNKIISISMFFFATPLFSKAQFFYKDIISTTQAAEELETYQMSGVHNIKINSIESNGEPSEGFFCEKKISKDYKKVTLYTKLNGSSKSILISYFNEKKQLLKTYDSSEIVVSSNEYEYDNKGRLTSIKYTSHSNDDDFVNQITEEHVYFYKEENLPQSMYRIKNTTDTTIVLFSLDEHNNISIEKETKNASKYYYYYNTSHKLTDIVHSNEYKNKLVADYLFEYNAQGLLSQMTTTEDGNDNFSIWKYSYDDKLKTQERIFSKDGVMLGKMEYEYK